MRIPETADFAMVSERSSIRWYYVYSLGLLLLGIITLIVVFTVPSITSGSESLKPIITIAGCFISSMGGFPLKEVIAREQRVRYLRWLKAEAQQPGADQTQLETLLLDFVKKGIA
jgi:hypothetical protein